MPIISRFVYLLLCAMLYCCFAIPTATQADTRVVRVGFFDLPGFMSQDDTGAYSGYAVDFLQELTKYSGLKIEYVHAPWTLCLKMLSEGKIDMLAPLSRAYENTTLKAIFPSSPMGIAHNELRVRADDTRYAYGDYKHFHGMRVGVTKNSLQTANLLEVSKQRGFSIDVHEFGTVRELQEALFLGTIDAILAPSLSKQQAHQKTILRFAPRPFYFALSPANDALHQELLQKMEELQITDPSFIVRLYNRYYEGKSDTLAFTRNEYDALQQQIVLKAAYIGEWNQLISKKQDGQFTGIIPSILDSISDITGCTFRIIHCANSTEALRLIQEDKIDLLCDFTGNEPLPGKEPLLLSPPYFHLPLYLIVRKDRGAKPLVRSMAIPTDRVYALHKRICERHQLIPVYCKDRAEAFRAVADGRADITWCNIHMANTLLQQNRFSSLEVAGLSTEQMQVRLAFSPRLNPLVVSALSKSLLHLPQNLSESTQISNLPPADPWLLYRQLAPWLAALLLATMAAIAARALTLRAYARHWGDPITKLPLLGAFRCRADQLVEDHPPNAYALVCLYIHDITGIYDRHGIEVGHRLRRRVANILRMQMHNKETLGQVSPSRFLALLRYEADDHCSMFVSPDEKTATSKFTILEIQRRLQALSQSADFPFPVVINIGVHVISDKSVPAAIARVLHITKSSASPHKHTCTFDKDGAQYIEERMQEEKLIGEMEIGLHEGQFEAYFQPKVDIHTGEVTGTKALVRWHHPRLDFLSPSDFLPLFGRRGRICDIDNFMLENICHKLRRLSQQKSLPATPIACNLSPQHLLDEHFSTRLLQLVERCQTPPTLLMLEIEESTALANSKRLFDVAATLKQAGFLFSVSHFGADTASLRLLTQLQPNEVKLDKSLLDRAMHAHEDAALLHACLDIAQSMGILVVATKIEEQAQKDFLIQHGVRYAQGFLFAKPMPFDDYIHFYTKNNQADSINRP